MSPLVVVPDGVAGTHPETSTLLPAQSSLSTGGNSDISPDPLGDRTVLLLLLGELALDAERLESGLQIDMED